MGNRAGDETTGDARRSVQATLILFIRTKYKFMQVNLKPRLDSLKSTKHECSYAGKYLSSQTRIARYN